MHSSDAPIPKYSELVYNGFWFSPEREALQALITETQRDVTRLVRLKLYKGNVIVAGRKSPKSLYDPKIATMEGDASAYDQSNATGFIRLNTLRLRLRAAMTQTGGSLLRKNGVKYIAGWIRRISSAS
jgi:argininosuccinate synthase